MGAAALIGAVSRRLLGRPRDALPVEARDDLGTLRRHWPELSLRHPLAVEDVWVAWAALGDPAEQVPTARLRRAQPIPPLTVDTFYALWWAELLTDLEVLRWGVWQPDQVAAQRRAVLQGVTRGLQDREDLTLERAGWNLAGTLSKCTCGERYLRREVPGAARLWRELGQGLSARPT